MKKYTLRFLSALCLVLTCHWVYAEEQINPLPPQPILFDIGGNDQFDDSLLYDIEREIDEKGRLKAKYVDVDLDLPEVRCPLGLGRWEQDRQPFHEIRFHFLAGVPGPYWLHVTWNGTRSLYQGLNQFEVISNGQSVGKSAVVDSGNAPDRWLEEKFEVQVVEGSNQLSLRLASATSQGMMFKTLALCTYEDTSPLPRPVCPTMGKLYVQTLDDYERVIKEPGVMLDTKLVRMFAPRQKLDHAKIVLGYIIRIYNEYYRLIGAHTRYKPVIFCFPEKSPYLYGGMDQATCTILYSFGLVDLDNSKLHRDWKDHGVPHIGGVAEEMGHMFMSPLCVEFGIEAEGALNSRHVLKEVLRDTPLHAGLVEKEKQAIQVLEKTVEDYRAAGYMYPKDYPAQGIDRLYAYILRTCEAKYGPDFWPHFWREVRKDREQFAATSAIQEKYEMLDARHRLAVECFDRLPGVEFKKMLSELQVSATTSGYSLIRGKFLDWDRRYIPPRERIEKR